MSRSEWLRTFVAVYRTGSVTVGARSRGLSQPAASQQLAALSRAVGGPVLSRTPRGVTPTERGRDLYARVAEPLDRLELVLTGLDGGRVERLPQPVRVGASAELFEACLLPRLAPSGIDVMATFADDATLLDLLLSGEVDVAVTRTTSGRRAAVESVPMSERTYSLVVAPGLAPDPAPGSLHDLAGWLRERPWVSYSQELPVTRRFWTTALELPFESHLRLVAPDLRTVAAAVELGMGVSLLPTYACARALADGRMVELYDVQGLVRPEPCLVTTRRADAASPRITEVRTRLTGS